MAEAELRVSITSAEIALVDGHLMTRIQALALAWWLEPHTHLTMKGPTMSTASHVKAGATSKREVCN